MPKGHNPEHTANLILKYRWALEDVVVMLSFEGVGSHIEDTVKVAVRRRALRALSATEEEVVERVRVRKGPEE